MVGLHQAGRDDPVAFAVAALAAELGIDPERDVLGEWRRDDILASRLREYARLLEANTAGDRKLAETLARALASATDSEAFEAVRAVCFTAAGTPRARKPSKEQAKRLGEGGEARLLELHALLCERIEDVNDELAAQLAFRLNRAGLLCGAGLLAVYQRLKEERQLLDFADVEWRVAELLARSEYAEYMQYKLDSRYRHILLDEFQDTNPLQWQAMQAWLSAYGGDAERPTVFLVGDPKQSIYRFRRAEPRLFQVAAAQLASGFSAVRLKQDRSRRSAPDVVRAVNRVFSGEAEFADFRAHGWYHDAIEGALRVLPLAQNGHAGEAPETGGQVPETAGVALRNPLLEARGEAEDRRHEEEAALLAQEIAAIVGHWRVDDEKTGARPAQYRDVMLLMRSRTWAQVYERALRTARIPYLGSRQGGLLDTLECGDLVALLEFLVAPFADLKLAQVLRSPIFGAGDGDLMRLAHGEAETGGSACEPCRRRG